MIRNHLKIAFRNLITQKGYSIINIAGLSISLAITLLMLLWVQDEWSIDKFHTKENRIFRIQRVLPQENETLNVNNNLPYPFLQAIEEEVPEVDKAVPIGYRIERLIISGKRGFRESGSFGNVAFF